MSAAEASTAEASTAEASTAAPAPAPVATAERADWPRPRPFSTRFLRSELMLIFGRRRNWAGLAVLVSVPLIIAIATRIWPPEIGSGEGPNFLSSITSNGLFVALTAITVELPLFLPLAVAAIAGDAVAGEANLGTLRYLLAVPVHRTRLLLVKYAAVVIFAVTATLLVAGVGALAGLLLFGGGPVTLLSGSQVPFGAGVLRLLGICLYVAAGLSALGAVGLFISTLTEQPIGATVAIVIFNVVSFILDAIPQLDWLHPYLLTHWWLAFGDLLRDPVSTDGLIPGLLTAAAYAAVFVTAAWARFAGKDVSS
jgi:ABC-2 type transport system permease protein